MKRLLKNVAEPNLFREVFSYDKIPAFKLDGKAVEPRLPKEFFPKSSNFSGSCTASAGNAE